MQATEQKERMPERIAEAQRFVPKAWICNITEEEFIQGFDFGEVRVQKCAPEEPFAVTEVRWSTTRMVEGEKSHTSEISALDIAREVVRLGNAHVGEHSFCGLFVIGDGRKEPSQKELSEAHKKLTKRYEYCVGIARGEWERTHRTDFITDEQRRAARYLNLTDEPWMGTSRGMELCEGCGIPHLPGIAKCGHCGAILDFAKAEKLRILPPHLMENKEQKPSANK
jgi:hypothetical protein